MRKIDDLEHERFNKALIYLKRELKHLNETELVVELDENRRALQSAYRKYRGSIEKLIENIENYDQVFTEVHTTYREAVKLKRKRKRSRS